MSALAALRHEILENGIDLRIDVADWQRIAELLPADGLPSDEDMRVLVEMRAEARVVCPEFDAYFFPTFKAYLLADGQLSQHEQSQVLRLLYGGGGIDSNERKFLRELRDELKDPSPEFLAMYDAAMSA